MPRLFDDELNLLRRKLMTMGALAETMIRDTTTALVEWETKPLSAVESNEDRMDALQREIDEDTIRLIGVYTPVASDLRLLLMTSRINAELERIGDQAMNIAFYTRTLLAEPPLKPLIDLPRMAEITTDMLKRVLDAFTERSSEAAVQVITMDDKVDQLNDQLFRELMTYVMSEPKNMSRVIELILISRAVERIADHAVTIAEDTVYMVEGRDIRHADESALADIVATDE